MVNNMINIDYRMFFVHRVIFGFWTLRRSIAPARDQWNIWPPNNYEYEVRWYWRKWQNRFPSRKIPWHRCWDWRNLKVLPEKEND